MPVKLQRYVSADCFSDDALKAVVRANLSSTVCSFSGATSARPIAAPLEVVAAHILAREDVSAYVSSFWWSALEGARDAAPVVRRAFIYSGAPDLAALIEGAKDLGLASLHPNHRSVTPELIALAHAAALRVNAWTVNDAARIAELSVLGVDGIASDFPERVPKADATR